MNRLILIFLLLFVTGMGFAQTNGYEESGSQDSGIPTQGGHFILDSCPVEVNLPDGFMCLDGKISRDILVKGWGNEASQVSDVVGIVIPDTTSSVANIDRAWIITYDKTGHVRDADAGSMAFDWILESLRSTEGFDNSKMSVNWARSPHYDTECHRLTLPFLWKTPEGEIMRCETYLFGKEGVMRIRPEFPDGDNEWFNENNDKIVNSFGFSSGFRYEDFDPEKDKSVYYSVSAFLKGVPTEAVTSDADALYDNSESPSLMSGSIRFIVIVALVVVFIMLLLMLGVVITERKRDSSAGIARSGVNVLLRIGVFAMVYLLILILAVFLVWLGVVLTIAILSEVIGLRIILAIIAGWIFIGGFLFAVIKSLFILKKSETVNRVEIHRNDAPELFRLIDEVAEASGQKSPKHVYLTADVNASVFYDKPFRSLFLPGRKNLQLGLGLLFGMNRQELKAILAHEYGHFGQKSMRVGSIVSLSYNVISNLVNAEGASLVRPVLRKTFLYVQKGFMSLSRSMEYGADEMSAEVAGKKAAISALYKLGVISERFEAYNSLLTAVYDEKKKVPVSYWNGYRLFLEFSDDFDGIVLDETVTATSPLVKTVPSRVKVENPWISHPEIGERVENIGLLSYVSVSTSAGNAESLVPQGVYDNVSRDLYANAGFINVPVCNDEEYRSLLKEAIGERSFPRTMRPFFNRNFFKFDLDAAKNEPLFSEEEIFSDSNVRRLEKFSRAVADYQILMMFQNGQIKQKEIQYDGKVYNRKNLPIREQVQLLNEMEPRVASIDKALFRLALSKASDKLLIMKAYDDIFYSQAVINHLGENIIPERDAVAASIGNKRKTDHETFERIQITLRNFQTEIIKLLNGMELVRLNPIMHVEMAKNLLYVENYTFDGDSINGVDVNNLLSIPDHLISLFQNLAYYSKKIVSDTIEGKTPLMYWNHSVASVKSAQNDLPSEA